MLRRLALAGLALTLAAGTAHAQVSYGQAAIPPRRALARVGLDMQWSGVVPLQGTERLTRISTDAGMLFAQTSLANFYAYDADSGRILWAANLGNITVQSNPASVSGDAVYVGNSNSLFALDRRTGRQIWSQRLTDTPSSATIANAGQVFVGTDSGKLEGFNAADGKIDFNIQTNARISSRPITTSRLVAFASEDNKVYLSKIESPNLLWRFATGGPVKAPLASHGNRTLLVASGDNNLYAIDLFSGDTRWIHATGAPVEREPLVVGDDVYVVNNNDVLFVIDALTGEPRWSVSTRGGRLLAAGATKVYLESHDGDLFVVDRASGKIIFDPTMTFARAGINLRDFSVGMTNRFDDRLYVATGAGLLLCLREINQVAPLPVRDPKLPPFGTIPREGLELNPAPTPASPTPTPDPAAEVPK